MATTTTTTTPMEESPDEGFCASFTGMTLLSSSSSFTMPNLSSLITPPPIAPPVAPPLAPINSFSFPVFATTTPTPNTNTTNTTIHVPTPLKFHPFPSLLCAPPSSPAASPRPPPPVPVLPTSNSSFSFDASTFQFSTPLSTDPVASTAFHFAPFSQPSLSSLPSLPSSLSSPPAHPPPQFHFTPFSQPSVPSLPSPHPHPPPLPVFSFPALSAPSVESVIEWNSGPWSVQPHIDLNPEIKQEKKQKQKRQQSQEEASQEEFGEPVDGVVMKKKYSLFKHQRLAVAWIREREQNMKWGIRGGIVSLEMGLGKTLVSLWLIASTKTEQNFPTLVLCSKSLISTWRNDCNKFFGKQLRGLFYHPTEVTKSQFLALTLQELHDYHFVLTTYDILRTTRRKHEDFIYKHYDDATKADQFVGPVLLFSVKWHRVIADESQVFANHKSSLLKAILTVQSERKLCLTGTPIRNYETDLYSQFRFCNFNGILRPQSWNAAAFHKFKLQEHILMLTYDDANVELPPKHEKIVHVTLQNESKQIYALFLRLCALTIAGMEEKKHSFGVLLANFTRLRQVCIAPFLIHPDSKLLVFENENLKKCNNSKKQEIKNKDEEWGDMDQEPEPEEHEDKNQTPHDEDDDNEQGEDLSAILMGILGGSARQRENEDMERLFQFIANAEGPAGLFSEKYNASVCVLRDEIKIQFQNPTESRTIMPPKVIIFSSFARVLILFAHRLLREGLPPGGMVLVDGKLKTWEREILWQRFRTDPNCQVLLMTYKVGSEGVTLTEANFVLFLDVWWCPFVKKQAIARAWRIGQERPVVIYSVLAVDTIEDRILQVGAKKEDMAGTMLSKQQRELAKLKAGGLDWIKRLLIMD